MNAFAADSDAPYKEVLNSINAEYDLDLGYVPVDKSQISLPEYEEKTRDFAIRQRELLDYIEEQEISAKPIDEAMTCSYVNKKQRLFEIIQIIILLRLNTLYIIAQRLARTVVRLLI